MQFEEAVKQFLKHLELERGCTSCTVSAYTSDLRIFLRYLQEADVEPDSDRVTPLVMRRYVGWLAGGGARPASVQRRVAAVLSMWKWLVGYEYAIMNPCMGLVLPRKGRRMPAVLTTEEARRVLAASEEHPNVQTAFRNRAVMHVLLFCGLRRVVWRLVGFGSAQLQRGQRRRTLKVALMAVDCGPTSVPVGQWALTTEARAGAWTGRSGGG